MNGLTKEQAKTINVGQFFSLYEVVHSDTAEANGLVDAQLAITDEQIENAKWLSSEVLDKVRNQFGRVDISSWFRSAELNSKTKGAKNSAHLTGEAADIQMPNLELVFRYIKNHLWFDQVILERKGSEEHGWIYWIHVSKKRNSHNRGEAFYMTNGKVSPKFEVK